MASSAAMGKNPDLDDRDIQSIVRDIATRAVDIKQTEIVQAEAEQTVSGTDIEVMGGVASLRVTRHVSTLVPPYMLKEYEEQQPGRAQIVFEHWVKDQDHRRSQECLSAERSHEIEKGKLLNHRIQLGIGCVVALAALMVTAEVA